MRQVAARVSELQAAKLSQSYENLCLDMHDEQQAAHVKSDGSPELLESTSGSLFNLSALSPSHDDRQNPGDWHIKYPTWYCSSRCGPKCCGAISDARRVSCYSSSCETYSICSSPQKAHICETYSICSSPQKAQYQRGPDPCKHLSSTKLSL